ncbi:hypothetical protein BHYA_0520g00010 [Botrytis hyacinthi]|uniref:Methyltransferase type 11 domain-containing protein n=1 Tax=Botrytis hyacinthi TaxID=278943 RepID=A0A4Z1G3I2_9HELO|nr:hypothetical protein BHYA_0520g00010 [Botrytis hyacinthi]
MATTTDVSPLCDSFNTQTSTCERRLGGSTRRVIEYATSLLSGLPENPNILDSACGPAYIYAADVASGMIALLENLINLNGWQDRVETSVMDSVSLSYADEIFDVSITNFGIFFYSDPIISAKELNRTLKSGGKAVVTCWKEVPFYPILHAVQAIIRPGTKPIAMSTLDRWTQRETMELTLKAGDFHNVEIHEKEVMRWNEGVHEAAKGFTDNFVNMVGDQWPEEDKKQLLGARKLLLEENKNGFVVKSGENIGFRMVAWIAIATKTML